MKNDPEVNEAPVIYAFKLHRDAEGPRYEPILIGDDASIGRDFEVVDIDADGCLDVVTANIHGVYLLTR